MSNARRVRRGPLAIVATCLLAGCATNAYQGPPAEPPQRRLAEVVPPGRVADPIAVDDPLETANRDVYTFNARFDRTIFLPVVETYEAATPEFLRNRVSDFFLNLGEVKNFTNSVLQASPEKAVPTLFRFTLNSTIGLLGLFDIATEFGIPRQDEDFGQTLGYWGVGTGPYLVLPILGPSNLRDTVGTVADALTFSFIIPQPVGENPSFQAAEYGLQPIDVRYRTPFRYYGTGSPFEYELVRYFSVNARRLQAER